MYIWLKKIQSVTDCMVCFESEECIKITPKQKNYIITDEPTQPSDYRDIVMNAIMPEVEAILELWEEEKETTLKLVNLLEEHDVSIAEVQKIIDLITANRIAKYNAFMEEKVGEEIKKFQSDMERYKDISQTLSDSHKRIICLAVGKALGTFVDGEPFEDARDNIRLSHLTPFIN